jgi:predicted AAA+ superfamily ATPase
MKAILDNIIDEFHERSLPALVRREAHWAAWRGKATAVIGMRRAGKTWFCYQHMQTLLRAGVAKSRMLYVNFEDDRLLPFAPSDFQVLLDAYFRKYPNYKSQTCYFYFDEIQRIAGWEAFVRRALDTENAAVCVTGSSSRLLSSEIATSLRGRALAVEIFPYSFREYLVGLEIDPDRKPLGAKMRAIIQHAAGNYLRTGGFPEVIGAEDALRRQILRGYVDVVLLRDVVERYRVSNLPALRALVHHFMSAPAARFSVNKFSRDLKSQGVTCGKNDLYAFLAYLNDAFLIHEAPIHTRSERVRRVNPRKIYIIDAGLHHAHAFQKTDNWGMLLENIVFMHLRRHGIHPAYYLTERGGEVDFVVEPERAPKPLLLQVCWSLGDPGTKSREINALREAMRELKIDRGTIVTWLDEEAPEHGVEIVPAWKWLLREAGGGRE